MARITVEDCLTKETSRFALVQLSSMRTKQLLRGASAAIEDTRGNKFVVTSLREIAAGRVRFMTQEEVQAARDLERERREREDSSRVRPPVVSDSKSSIFLNDGVATPSDGEGGEGDEGGEGKNGELQGDDLFKSVEPDEE